MHPQTTDKAFRAGFFETAAKADLAVRNLLAAGFTKDELAIICPARFKKDFTPDVPQATRPGSGAVGAVVEGGAVGGALGGLALAATAVATGGVALIPALTVLVGGGAIAGGFSNLIVQDGYGKGIGELYEQAIQKDKIVVGVHKEGVDSSPSLAIAESVLAGAGAESLSAS